MIENTLVRCAVTTYLWAAELTPANLAMLSEIRAAGFDGVEMPIFRPAEFAAREIRRACAASALDPIAACALVDGLSLVSDDVDVRRRTVSHLADVVKAAADVGAHIVAGPVYAPVGYLPGRRRTRDEWMRAVEGYQQLVPTLDAHDVTLAIEPLNRFETYFLNTAADAADLCDAVGHPRVGVVLDTFHANIEEKDIAGGYRRVARHLKHVHTSENDRGTPGRGHVDWPAVFGALHEIGYDGWLTIESFGFALGDLSAAASIWRDLEPTPQSIAVEGLRFLRGAWN